MNPHSLKASLLLATLVLTGCGLFGKKDSVGNADAASTQQFNEPGSSTAGYGSEAGAPAPVQIGGSGLDSGTLGSGAGAGGADGGNIIYFEFDSIELTESGRSIVAATGRYLSANPAARVRLEGHADERGTREYNVGLAERRAASVQRALVASGADASQLSVLSFGEERPATPGHDESAWALNRRVEVVR